MKKSLICIAVGALMIQAHAQPTASTLVRDIETLSPTSDTPSTDTTPITVSSVVLQGNRSVGTATLQPLLDSYVGTTTLDGLHDLARQIESYYQSVGYPLVSVIVPPQTIDGGVVVLQVIEGTIDTIALHNHSLVNNNTVQRLLHSHIKTGTTLSQQNSDKATALLKQLSGVGEVQQSISTDGTNTALVTTLTASPRLTGAVQVDNYGSASTGQVRVNANATINSPMGLGDELSIQAMTSFKGVHHAKADIKVPTGQHGMRITAGLGHTRYELGGSFKDLNAKGTAQTANIGIRYPIKSSSDSPIWLAISADNKNLSDTIAATSTNTNKTIKSLSTTINGTSPTKLFNGSGSLSYALTGTLGNLAINSDDAKALDRLSAKTQGTYFKTSADISHTQFVGQKLSIMTALNGQWTNKNLDASEQISLGGSSGVSAYHSNDFSADSAVIGKIEARYAFSPYLSVGGFYDVGKAKLRQNPYLTGDNNLNLHGGGIGIYANYKTLSAQAKVAWRGNRDGNTNNTASTSPMTWLQIGTRF